MTPPSFGMSSFQSMPLRPHPVMSPETALVEFISASASFHGVKKQNLKQLEFDILKVFENNIMPANAAAWYMGKKRFYEDYQLLPTILKNYPKRFAIHGTNIEFLDVYKRGIANEKLKKMVRQGLVAYFTHKMDDYGVYFFDPYYYETTEPFVSSFRQVLGTRTPVTDASGRHGKLTKKFFVQHKDKFVFQPVNEFLVTISREPVEVRVNATCIVSSMIDNQFGTLSFGEGNTVHRAYFSAKSLYKDGYQYNGDPRDLPHMFFDGYRMPTTNKGGKPTMAWVAVLVWSGKKPSPRFCANKVDLYAGGHYLQNEIMLPASILGPGGGNNNLASIIGSDKSSGDQNLMQVGQVMSINDRGALVSLKKDGEERAYIPGWQHTNGKSGVRHLVTTQGVELTMGDLITFYIDPKARPVKGCKAVGCNVLVLKHEDKSTRKSLASTSDHDANGNKKTKKGRNRKMSSKSVVSTDGETTDGGRRRDKKTKPKKRSSYRDFLLKDEPVEEPEDEEGESDSGDKTVKFVSLDEELTDEEIEEEEVDELLKDLDLPIEALRKMFIAGMNKIEAAKIAAKEEQEKATIAAKEAREKAKAEGDKAKSEGDEAKDDKDKETPSPAAEGEKPAEKEEAKESAYDKIAKMRLELSESIEKELEKMFGKPMTPEEREQAKEAEGCSADPAKREE